MSFVENAQIKLLANAMDAYQLRQKITASNIANIDTPGYDRMIVSFEDELRRAGGGSMSAKPLVDVDPEVVQTDEQPVLEQELMVMSDTQMRVQLVSRALRENFEQLRTGITGH